MYNHNKDNNNIRKNNFDIFIRKHDVSQDSGLKNIFDIASDINSLNVEDQYIDIDYTSITSAGFRMIGDGNKKPIMKNNVGQLINLNTDIGSVVFEDTEMSLEGLNINADNYFELRSLMASGKVDALFVNLSKTKLDTGVVEVFGVSNLKIYC